MDIGHELQIAALEGERQLLEEMVAYFKKPFWSHPIGTKFPHFAGECRPQFRLQEIDREIKRLQNQK